MTDYTCGVCLEENENIELPIKLDCGHVFCFMCAKTWLTNSHQQQCPLCRRVVNHRLGSMEAVQELLDQMDIDDSKYNYIWQYAGRSNGVWDYAPNANKKLEDQYRDYVYALRHQKVLVDGDSRSDGSDGECDETSEEERERIEELSKCELDVGVHRYIVDFRNMVQYPENNTQRVRKVQRVKRDDVPNTNSKGTGGLEQIHF